MSAFPKEFTRSLFKGIYRNQAIICFASTTRDIWIKFDKYVLQPEISILIPLPHSQILILYSIHDFPESMVYLQPWEQENSY